MRGGGWYPQGIPMRQGILMAFSFSVNSTMQYPSHSFLVDITILLLFPTRQVQKTKSSDSEPEICTPPKKQKRLVDDDSTSTTSDEVSEGATDGEWQF